MLIGWQLDSAQAEMAAAGRSAEPDVDELLRSGAATILTVGSAGEPVSGASDARVLICQVPEDIVAIRHSDPAMARSWRLALRRAIGDALRAGYEVSGATRDGWYVLER
jgi:predicted GNAT superfamily acetyltransferase